MQRRLCGRRGRRAVPCAQSIKHDAQVAFGHLGWIVLFEGARGQIARVGKWRQPGFFALGVEPGKLSVINKNLAA